MCKWDSSLILPLFLPTAAGLHPVPGGVFPVPPAAVVLMKLLPPPSCFTVSYGRLSPPGSSLMSCQQQQQCSVFNCFCPQGPFVQVDELMETFRRCTLPESKFVCCLCSRSNRNVVQLLVEYFQSKGKDFQRLTKNIQTKHKEVYNSEVEVNEADETKVQFLPHLTRRPSSTGFLCPPT